MPQIPDLSNKENYYLFKELKFTLVQERVRDTEELLAKPPRKRLKKFPQVIYGDNSGSAWSTPLHQASEDGNPEKQQTKSKTSKMKEDKEMKSTNLTQESLQSDISLNEAIKMAYERRKGDAAMKKGGTRADAVTHQYADGLSDPSI